MVGSTKAGPKRRASQASARVRKLGRKLGTRWPIALDLAFPELGMRLLDRAEAGVDLRQLGVLLGLRQGSVERGAVDLALQIGGVALPRIFLGHFYSLSKKGLSPRVRLQPTTLSLPSPPAGRGERAG